MENVNGHWSQVCTSNSVLKKLNDAICDWTIATPPTDVGGGDQFEVQLSEQLTRDVRAQHRAEHREVQEQELDANYICEILVRYSNTKKWTDTRESGLRNTRRLYRIGDNCGWSSADVITTQLTLSEPREHMQQGTQVSNVQWISTTILPVYSCCYYYRSLVSIEYPDRRLWSN